MQLVKLKKLIQNLIKRKNKDKKAKQNIENEVFFSIRKA